MAIVSGIVSGVSVALGFGSTIIFSFYPPLGNKLHKWAWARTPNANPAIGELIEMRWRGEINAGRYLELVKEAGINNQFAESLFSISKQLLNAYDYVSLYRRGNISQSELYSKLKEIHITNENVKHLLDVSEYFPSPSDLISFAVREVYNPSTVAKFGLLEDLPTKFLEEAKKAGLPEEQAKNYWIAHWQLPSVSQGYEMYQRRIIDKDSLTMLMKALDIMPYWRDKLIEMSYRPLTRVDVRRMYSLGVLSVEDVYKSYLDNGYSPENAKRMTAFTVKYESGNNKGLTKSIIIKAYKESIINDSDFIAMFGAIGYDEKTAQFYLNMSKYEKSIKDLKDLESEMIAQYKLGYMDIGEIRNKLTAAGVDSGYIDVIIARIYKKEHERIKLPTKADLQDWLENNIIDENEFKNRMSKIGYSKKDILNYITIIKMKQPEKKEKFLSLSVYKKWYLTDVIGKGELTTILKKMGYRQKDINTLITNLEEAKNESKNES